MLIFIITLLALVAPTTISFRHTWETSAHMTFADMNAPKLLEDRELSFVSAHYRVFSMEKCSGAASGNNTEEYIYSTSSRLKQLDPTTKTIFYWAMDQQGIRCYDAHDFFRRHKDWHLLDDNGNVVSNGHGPVLDFTNADASKWWSSYPLLGDDGKGNWRGKPIGQFLDGVLADGAHRPTYKNVSSHRLDALADAKFQAIGEMQRQFTALNGGEVMANGINMYPPPNADPRYPNNYNLQVLNFSLAIMNEHTAAFESVIRSNASYNYQRVSEDLHAIDRAAAWDNNSRTVYVQTWPGMYSGVQQYPPVSSGGEPTPQTNDEWRDALRRHFSFAHALALVVAQTNVFWFYGSTWYSQSGGFIPCPNDIESCRAPPEWYPDLKKPLGAPLGPRVEVDAYVWTREFEHASVLLNLIHPNVSKVTFHAIEH